MYICFVVWSDVQNACVFARLHLLSTVEQVSHGKVLM